MVLIKNKIITIIILGSLIVSIFAIMEIVYVFPISPLRKAGTDRLNSPGNIVLRIEKNLNCVPVSLYLYDDSTYELFTEHKTCRPLQTCIMRLYYTKSIKGAYDYDLIKILDYSIDESEISDYKEIDYVITPGIIFGGVSLSEEYDHEFVVKKGNRNKYLKEFLDRIDVDLNQCSYPDYY